MKTRAETVHERHGLNADGRSVGNVGERTAIGRLGGDAVVAVVETADLWGRDHATGRGRRN